MRYVALILDGAKQVERYFYARYFQNRHAAFALTFVEFASAVVVRGKCENLVERFAEVVWTLGVAHEVERHAIVL